MARRHPGFETPGSIIRRAVHDMGPQVETPFRRYYVLWHWREIVGHALASNVRPLYIRFKTLYLYTFSASWKNEVAFLQDDIISKVNQFAGEKMIDSIKFGYDKDNKGDFSLQSLRDYEDKMKTLSKAEQSADISRIPLDDEEYNIALEITGQIEDKKLKESFQRLIINWKKLEKYRASQGFKRCVRCGVLCVDEDNYCSRCKRTVGEEVRRKIRSHLREAPWMRYGELSRYIEGITPAMVNNERADMVQKLVRELTARDKNTLKAKLLVMLFLAIPPEKMNDALVDKVFRRLSLREGYRP